MAQVMKYIHYIAYLNQQNDNNTFKQTTEKKIAKKQLKQKREINKWSKAKTQHSWKAHQFGMSVDHTRRMHSAVITTVTNSTQCHQMLKWKPSVRRWKSQRKLWMDCTALGRNSKTHHRDWQTVSVTRGVTADICLHQVLDCFLDFSCSQLSF